MNLYFNKLKERYPKLLNDATEIRTLTDVPGVFGTVLEIFYEKEQRRTIRFGDQDELSETLKELEKNL